jgi:hypothetical protein
VFAANLDVPPVPEVPILALGAVVFVAATVANLAGFQLVGRAAHSDLAQAGRVE